MTAVDPLVAIYNRRLVYYTPLKHVTVPDLARLVNVDAMPGPTLDVGCGTGISAQSLHEVVGIDYAERRIDKARQLYPRHEWITATAEDWLEATKRRFRSALLVEVLEHVPDPHRLLAAARGVTDGPVVATVPVALPADTHRHVWNHPWQIVADFDPEHWATFGQHVVMSWGADG